MRIGVLRTQVPFVTGGAERHAAGLVAALNRHGHEAVEITLPFKWYPGEVLARHVLAAKMFDLTEVEGVPVDRVIGLKFPAWLPPHPDKIFWIIHQHRQAYDMWSSGQSDLLHDPDGEALRQLVQDEDRAAFAASPHPVYTNSRNVSDRLKRYLDLPSTPLYHPPPQAERFWQGGYGDYLFAPGRINPSKRLDLILRALAETRSRMRLVVAGTAENPAYQDELRKLALDLGVGGQVEWLGRVDDATLLKHYAEARAVVFVPRDEDYGYITLEAMLAARPVITVTDAGGPLEFIDHEGQGLVVAPTPAELGRAFDRILQEPALAEQMGQSGHLRFQERHITWDHVVETLAGKGESIAAAAPPPPEPEGADAAPGPTVQEEAVARLAAAIAPPPPPPGFPFATIAEVLAAYEFDELPRRLGEESSEPDPGLVSYLGTHWTRFLTTLDAIGDEVPGRVLDVGVFPPLVFQALLANRYDGVEMAGLWEGPDPYAQEVRARGDHPDFSITLSPANSERDPWPFAAESFDLVTGMEILEHLALDPHFFFTEAARVLRPGGRLLLTTPNVVSHRGVWKTLNGIAPYSFGIFVPTGGVYGRHNREYAPPELVELGRAAGLSVERLTTHDVYDRHIDPATAELLAGREDDLSLRGENIVYVARKDGVPGAAPERFYHGDPVRMAAAFHPGPWEDDTGLLRLDVENRSPAWWPVVGDRATCLLAEWIDPAGILRHQHLFQPFASQVGPGQRAPVTLRLDPAAHREGRGELRLHAYQAGTGVFTGTGRAATLRLPCSEEAFLRLAKTAPRPVAGTP